VLTAEAFVRSGKVRDLFELPDGRLLLIATDRISAFDVVLPTEIPDKGRVLTGLSRFWFAETESVVPNHLLDTDVAVIKDAWEAAIGEADVQPTRPLDVEDFASWRGRVMICRPADVIPIEAVVRGFLAGSGWGEYQATGHVGGIRLPQGLQESDRLAEPIFTPATKAPAGEHDENIDFDGMVRHIADQWSMAPEAAGVIAEAVRERSLALYRFAAATAARTGILIADTKFEFGIALPDGGEAPEAANADRGSVDRMLLIDEVLTPDSSRFWDVETYQPGRPQASFDKQYVRDWLVRQPWDKTAPGPILPDDVVRGTRERYVAAFERITGASFDRYLAEDVIAR
jgi:phosphoribosylaminoimidazole-succinocarboxamide synthase